MMLIAQLPRRIGGNFGGHTRQQATQGLDAIALQRKGIFELVDHLSDHLPFARRPARRRRSPGTFGGLGRGGRDAAPVLFPAGAFPVHRGEALIGQIGGVAFAADEDGAD